MTVTIATAQLTSIATDTGASSTDFVTSDNNSAQAGALKFGVSVTMSGSGGTTKLSIILRPVGAVNSSQDITSTATNVNGGTLLANVAFPATIADGAYTVIIMNGARVVSPPSGGSNPTVTIDTTAPGAPSVTFVDTFNPSIPSSSTDHVTSNATLSGTTSPLEVGDRVSIKENGVEVASAIVDANGQWSATPSGLAQGAHSFAVTMTDVAGNASGATTIGYTLDTIAPTLSLSALSADGGKTITSGRTNATGITVGGTTDASATTVTITDNGNVVATVAATAGAWSYDVTGLADGSTHSFAATAMDAAGNVSATLTAQTVTIDTTPPTLSIDALTANGDNVLNHAEAQGALRISGTTNAEDGQTVSVGLAGKTYLATVATGAWHVDVPSTDLGALTDSGTYPVTASVSDIAGNATSATPVSLAVDVSAPSSMTFSPLSPDSGAITSGRTNASGITVSGTTEAGVSVQLYDNGVALGAPLQAGADGKFSFDDAGISAGSHAFTATATDAAGNVSQVFTDATVVIDRTAPTIAITTPLTASGDNTLNIAEAAAAGGLTIAGTTTGAEDGQQVTVTLNSKSYTATVANNAWSVNVGNSDVAALADGSSYTIAANVSDVAGNAATAATQTLAVDLTAPPVPTIALTHDTGASGSDLITRNGAITGTDGLELLSNTGFNTDLAGWSVSNGHITVANGLALVAPPNGGNTALTQTFNVVSGHNYTVSVDAIAPDSGMYLFVGGVLGGQTIKTSASMLTNTYSFTAGSSGSLTVGVRAATNSSSVYSLDNFTVTDNSAGGALTYSVASGATNTSPSNFAASPSYGADGQYTVVARATDAAGNTTNSAPLTFTLDTTAPTLAASNALTTDQSANADLKAGKTVQISVRFDENMAVSGTPTLTLNDGGTATYASGAGSNTLVFSYTVGAGQNTSNLAVSGLNGAVIDTAGNVFTGALSGALGVQIDTTAPTISITTPLTTSGDNTLNIAEAAAAGGLTIAGTTTGAEDGQQVTVTLNSKSYTATVANNAWSVNVGHSDVAALGDGSNYTIAANVSDAAGNAATAATKTLAVDITAPGAPGVALTTDTGSSSTDKITSNGAISLSGPDLVTNSSFDSC